MNHPSEQRIADLEGQLADIKAMLRGSSMPTYRDEVFSDVRRRVAAATSVEERKTIINEWNNHPLNQEAA